MSHEITMPLYFYFKTENMRNKQYRNDLDFIHAHTDTDFITFSTIKDACFENAAQCHDLVADMVSYAHKLGIKVSLKIASPDNGYFNDDQFPIADPKQAQGLVYDYEKTADDNGYCEFTSSAKWALHVFRPIRNRVLKCVAFRKTGRDTYDPNSFQDITDKVQIIKQDTRSVTVDVFGGKENAGKTVFIMFVQYFNENELFGDAKLKQLTDTIDIYADTGVDSVTMDEFGYMDLNISEDRADVDPDFINVMPFSLEPVRVRHFSAGMELRYRELGFDLTQMLLEMRYIPTGCEKQKIRAINHYYEEFRKAPIRIEKAVAKHCEEVLGADCPMACHNTWHQNLDWDEVYKTGFNWWDLPRYYGFTDGSVTYPVRMGVMLSEKAPRVYDMHYFREEEPYYEHMSYGLPFGSRLFHHAYNDGYWGQDYKNTAFLENIQTIHSYQKMADSFTENVYPKLDLLLIFGCAAQTNWYPDYSARNDFDQDGKMKVLDKAESLWSNGYRLALISDDCIRDGKVCLQDGKMVFNGHAFDHTLFLYPKYAKKETYQLLNQAGKEGVSIAAVGEASVDFDGDTTELNIPVFSKFDITILEKIGCPKGEIPGGGVLQDGSFILSDWQGMLYGKKTDFSFSVGKHVYSGTHTGFLAFRENNVPLSSPGTVLFADGKKIL